ncbi:MAG: esterase-like activity of phytase family protein [Brevundimonas sp.]|uniref:esterase-like activity of phytase family protein n=1 Tax=Brevundimonas sp. TaxID=1871086 RepID=UPI0025BA8945|nr:esterase-like activity of phytase family protein [Brevundimonas sp.]MBX3476998.1 esterase-like activity of phytase family protein [Brevundimonas sp.]
MIPLRRFVSLALGLTLAACAGGPATGVRPWTGAEAGWTAAAAENRAVGLGLPGGAVLAPGVAFAGGIEIVLAPDSPLHSLSDLKLTGETGFISVTDAGDLVRGELRLDGDGRLTGVERLRYRRLTLRSGDPIVDKADGDAEGLAFTEAGDLLISFERDHRIWNYGRGADPAARPTPAAMPDYAFPLNDGMEAMAASGRGWVVAGESGGVWNCNNRDGCITLVDPPERLLADSEFRITGMDANPFGAGWYVVQRSFTPPVDARAQVRRMRPDGELGPVLIELKLPGVTDNFEGIAAERRGDGVRLYLLSDDNSNPPQRTLLLAFDLAR